MSQGSFDNALHWIHLGEGHRRSGQSVEAMMAVVRALSLEPGLAEGWAAAGRILHEQGETEGAVTCLSRATRLAPERAPSPRPLDEVPVPAAPRATVARLLAALATTLSKTGPFEEPIVLFRRAIAVDPALQVAHAHLGAVLLKADRLEDGLASLRRALEIHPDDAASRLNLGSGLMQSARHAEGVREYRRAIALKPGDAYYHSHLVGNLHFVPGLDPGAILEEAREWDRRHAAPLAPGVAQHANDRTPDRRLRIGYVSPDFRMHCQRFFTVPLLTHHDRDGFEIHCYSSVLEPDLVTERIGGLADRWRSIAGMDDAAAASAIRDDGIDILVDLTMHMENNRLPIFARKPAPVQISWLAYPGTTGLSAIDYRVTDRHLDPPGLDTGSLYSERSIRLPDTFWCYDPLTTEPEVGPLPARETGTVRFGCLNNFCKMSDDVLGLWARVLREVRGSRLLLLAPPGEASRRTAEAFGKNGVERERIELVPLRPHAEYLATYRRIDVGLDPFPYNGHTTSLDAFWMGVPVVTLVGSTVVGRAGLCQAKNLGLPEIVATTPDEYVRIAVELSRDLDRLGELRAGLRARMMASPLMDGARFARNLEAAYRGIWRRWCAGADPSDFP